MANPTSDGTTAGMFLQFPFNDWTPEALIARTENKEIPFQTSMHRTLIAEHLIQNKENLQNVFNQTITQLIELQNKIRNNMTLKTDLLTSDDYALTEKSINQYLGALRDASWVLPMQGFIDSEGIDEKTIPKCYGIAMLQFLMENKK